ncbi:MAG: hypothetical protein LRY71_02530 [Bacillaceae bacterium]|nr:hypothetical protein [Bacillaceae bacterium]
MKKVSLILLSAVLFIIGCSVTKDEAFNLAKQSFESGFTNIEEIETNSKTIHFEYYAPPNLQVEQETDTNLIFSEDEQLFIIFSNSAEDEMSQLNYEVDIKAEPDAEIIEKIELEDLFAYLIISPFEEEYYKVTVGRGGEKGTTIATLDDLQSSVETIVDIINSITYK